MLENFSDRWGPVLVLSRDEFGSVPDDEPDIGDRFAERQDAIHRINVGLAEADAEASSLLTIASGDGGPLDVDFPNEIGKALRRRRRETLSVLRDPRDREEAEDGFDTLVRRHGRAALEMDRSGRIQRRAAGAEQALARIAAAAVAEPDSLSERLNEANLLLGRMVEAGVNPQAAAARAGQFRNDIGAAVLDDLADRDPLGAVARLDSGLFDGLIAADNKDSTCTEFLRIAEADDRAAERRKAWSEQTAIFEAGARRRSAVERIASELRADQADEGTIERALFRGEIEEEDALDLQARLQNVDDERRRMGEEIDRLDTAVKSGVVGAAAGTWPQETVNAWWFDEQRRGTAVVAHVPNCHIITGCIPRPYLDSVRSRILSGLPDDLVAAAHEFGVVRAQSGEAAEAILANLLELEADSLTIAVDIAGLDLPSSRIAELTEERLAEAKTTSGSEVAVSADTLAPTDERIDPAAWKKALDYSEHGKPEFWNGLTEIPPEKWREAGSTIRTEALEAAGRAQQEHGLTNWERDAFQHAYWSYRLTESLGAEIAKKIGDAHERRSLQMMWTGTPNPEGERVMDLYNNHVGRQVFSETREDPTRPAEQVVMDALRAGRLQRTPFKVRR